MELIQSGDGTPIALETTGSGPPLVIVMGAFCDRSTSRPLAALLASRYTVYEYDRRGRGDSGNGLPISIEREVEDLGAVIVAARETAFVYGHSSGGLLALEAAARGVPMRRLAVYEPPYTGDAHPGSGFGEHLDALVAAGRRDQAAEQWLTMAGTPPAMIASMRLGPGWGHREALAHTLSQDLRLANDGRPPLERLARIELPVLALAGSLSPAWAAATTAALADALPDATAQVLEGQHHIPADAVVAEILARYLR